MDPSLRLRTAIKKGNYFIVVRLLKRYPDLVDNIDPTNGWTNLHYAGYYDRYEISDALLGLISQRNRGRSPSTSSPSSMYSQITDEDEIRLNFDNDTVIHTTCEGNAVTTLRLLLSYFNVCIDQRGNHGRTPSHVCCAENHPECLAVLLENEAYPNLIDDQGDTPLHVALQYGYMDCAQLLVNYNADDKMVNYAGWTPLDVVNDEETKNKYLEMKHKKDTTPTLSLPNTSRISLPSVRKCSLSSSASEDSATRDSTVSSLDSMPNMAQISQESSLKGRLQRKPPPTHESPSVSMSGRTLRSNSQTSDPSPTKSMRNRRGYSTSGSLNDLNDAALKLNDFKSKNQDRLKLDIRLGNILNRSQESLELSPQEETQKKSKILSIPISSLRRKRVQ